MSDDPVPNLHDIAAETFRRIGPARIGAFAVCVLQSGDLEPDREAEAVQEAVKRLTRADAALRHFFPSALEAGRFEEPLALRNLRHETIKVMDPLIQPLKIDPPDLATLTADMPALRRACFNDVEPRITEFLNLMTKLLKAEQQRREAITQEASLVAVREAETMGRSIQMIALNASIEAARAGEGGKGFEVIATEIRNLAGRTRALLRQISTNLQDSATK